MARIPLDLAGFRSNRLVGVSRHHQNRLNQWFWLCDCDCGNTSVVMGSRLYRKHVQSCGCLKIEKAAERCRKHGLHGTPEYKAYHDAKTRGTNPNFVGAKNYIERGITFLFKDFQEFLADIGPKPSPLHSVDRINNNGNYEPGNVRWATKEEQLKNRRPRKPLPRDPKTKRFLKKELWPA